MTKYLVEISDDRGNHAVIQASSQKEATEIYKTVKSGLGAEIDNDEELYRQPFAPEKWDNRDHDQFRVRTAPVVSPNEDLEPESDQDETPASNTTTRRWWK